MHQKLDQKSNINTMISSKSVQNNDDKEQIDKVKRRVPKWFKNPLQICSKILITFIVNKTEKGSLPYSELKKLCEDQGIKTFDSNLRSMKDFAERNHGKVFQEDNNKNISLWNPCASFIEEEYQKYLSKNFPL